MKIVVTALLIFSASISALAQPMVSSKAGTSTTKTDDVFAPELGQHEILAGALLPAGDIDSSFGKITISGYALALGYAYGVSPVLAPFIQQNYSRLESKSSFGSSTSLGFGDTKIGAKGIFDLQDKYLRYSVSYSSGLLDKSKSNSSPSESTQVSNRPSLSFLGGGGVTLQNIGLGGSFEYKIFQDGDEEVVSAGVTTTRKHKAGTGNNFKLYAQLEMDFKVGFSYQENLVEGYDSSVGATTTKEKKQEDKVYTIYSIIPVSSANDLILSIIKPEPKDSNGLTYNLYFLSASLRSTF